MRVYRHARSVPRQNCLNKSIFVTDHFPLETDDLVRLRPEAGNRLVAAYCTGRRGWLGHCGIRGPVPDLTLRKSSPSAPALAASPSRSRKREPDAAEARASPSTRRIPPNATIAIIQGASARRNDASKFRTPRMKRVAWQITSPMPPRGRTSAWAPREKL
jgi:hypothetical protein